MGSALAPLLIMLREGLEAALIVAIVATYLVQTGRRAWLPVMGVGIALAVAMSLYLGAALQWLAAEFPQKQQEFFEAVVGFLAVAMLTYMVLWMSSAGRGMAERLRDAVERVTADGGATVNGDGQRARGRGVPGSAAWALVFMVFLAVAREGLESVFFLLAVFQQSPGWQAPAGALAGVAVAALVGVLIYGGGLRLDLRRFFAWTALLIVLVAAGLLAGSLRKLHEAGIWNIAQQPVADWSLALPMDSVLGSVLAGLFGYQSNPVLSEALVYLAYLLLVGGALLWRARRQAKVALLQEGA
jgi:high-affinity iron transporter